jgi:hypothetical protein
MKNDIQLKHDVEEELQWDPAVDNGAAPNTVRRVRVASGPVRYRIRHRLFSDDETL